MQLIVLLSIILFRATVSANPDCSKYPEGHYIPTDLSDAIAYLDCKWSSSAKEEFKNQDEESAVGGTHFGTGMSIRNNWELWGRSSNALIKYFHSIGIEHPDDMSAIVLTSFHRHLNNKDIDLDAQVAHFVEYWKDVDEQYKKWNEDLRTTFDEFSIEDSVKIPVTVRLESGHEHFYLRWRGLKWDINDDDDEYEYKTCNVIGVIIDKQIKGTDSYTFNIRIIDVCGRRRIKLNNKEKLIIGKSFEYNISTFALERP